METNWMGWIDEEMREMAKTTPKQYDEYLNALQSDVDDHLIVNDFSNTYTAARDMVETFVKIQALDKLQTAFTQLRNKNDAH